MPTILATTRYEAIGISLILLFAVFAMSYVVAVVAGVPKRKYAKQNKKNERRRNNIFPTRHCPWGLIARTGLGETPLFLRARYRATVAPRSEQPS